MQEGPPLPPGLQAKADAQLAVLWPQIQTDEEVYFAGHGGYWQGLRTHTEIPPNAADVLPDVGAQAPHDQPAPWPAAYLANPIALAMTMDVYVGPAGAGYVLTATVQTTPPHVPADAAHVYSRALSVGPEAGWAHDWQVTPAAGIVSPAER